MDNMSDTESESELNEESPVGIDENFKKNIVELKRIIYNAIIVSPELGTSEAQNSNLIIKYISCMNDINNLFLEVQQEQQQEHAGQQQHQKATINNLEQFPKESHELLRSLLIWIADYYKKSEVYDIPPYQHYIYTKLKVYPLNMN
jgi:hypothetical protein